MIAVNDLLIEPIWKRSASVIGRRAARSAQPRATRAERPVAVRDAHDRAGRVPPRQTRVDEGADLLQERRHVGRPSRVV